MPLADRPFRIILGGLVDARDILHLRPNVTGNRRLSIFDYGPFSSEEAISFRRGVVVPGFFMHEREKISRSTSRRNTE